MPLYVLMMKKSFIRQTSSIVLEYLYNKKKEKDDGQIVGNRDVWYTPFSTL